MPCRSSSPSRVHTPSMHHDLELIARYAAPPHSGPTYYTPAHLAHSGGPNGSLVEPNEWTLALVSAEAFFLVTHDTMTNRNLTPHS